MVDPMIESRTIELDRRTWLGLTRARFTVNGAADGSEPRRAFRRLGTLRPELKALLKASPAGAAGVGKYNRLLFVGYACSVLVGILAGVAAGSLLMLELLGAMKSSNEMTPFLNEAYRILIVLPALRLAYLAIPLFVIALAVDYLAYRTILTTIDAAEPAEPEPTEPEPAGPEPASEETSS